MIYMSDWLLFSSSFHIQVSKSQSAKKGRRRSVLNVNESWTLKFTDDNDHHHHLLQTDSIVTVLENDGTFNNCTVQSNFRCLVLFVRGYHEGSSGFYARWKRETIRISSGSLLIFCLFDVCFNSNNNYDETWKQMYWHATDKLLHKMFTQTEKDNTDNCQIFKD